MTRRAHWSAGGRLVSAVDLPVPPRVGTRALYENAILGLRGWGEIVEPRDAFDADLAPSLASWCGTLVGPIDPSQAALDRLAPGCGVLPGNHRYLLLPLHLLFVEAPGGVASSRDHGRAATARERRAVARLRIQRERAGRS